MRRSGLGGLRVSLQVITFISMARRTNFRFSIGNKASKEVFRSFCLLETNRTYCSIVKAHNLLTQEVTSALKTGTARKEVPSVPLHCTVGLHCEKDCTYQRTISGCHFPNISILLS